MIDLTERVQRETPSLVSMPHPSCPPSPARHHLLDVDDWSPDELRSLVASAREMRDLDPVFPEDLELFSRL